MTLSELIAAMRLGAGFARADVGEDWMQGRSVFGGLQAAIALAAMRTLVPDPVPLRTLQMTFIAPVPAGAVSASARVLRAGKSATQVESRLEAGGETLAHVIGVFGNARESIVRRDVPPAPARTAPGRVLPHVAGVAPSFMQQFNVELLEGALPFSGKSVSRTVYGLGLRDSGSMTEAHLLAIADFVPPVALAWMPGPSPGSSVTWMLELLGADFRAQPLEGWHVESELVAARDGYTNQSSVIHAPDGAAIALSRQSMVVFG